MRSVEIDRGYVTEVNVYSKLLQGHLKSDGRKYYDLPRGNANLVAGTSSLSRKS